MGTPRSSLENINEGGYMTTLLAGGEWLVILPIALCCGLPLLLLLFGRRRDGEPKDRR